MKTMLLKSRVITAGITRSYRRNLGDYCRKRRDSGSNCRIYGGNHA